LPFTVAGMALPSSKVCLFLLKHVESRSHSTNLKRSISKYSATIFSAETG
jgi:hypothetical protein